MSSCEKLTWKSTKEGKSYFVRVGMRETKEKKVNKKFILWKPFVSTYNLYYFSVHLTTVHLKKQRDEFRLQLTIIPFYEVTVYIDQDKVTNSVTTTVRPFHIITMCIDRKQSGVIFLFLFQNKEFYKQRVKIKFQTTIKFQAYKGWTNNTEKPLQNRQCRLKYNCIIYSGNP